MTDPSDASDAAFEVGWAVFLVAIGWVLFLTGIYPFNGGRHPSYLTRGGGIVSALVLGCLLIYIASNWVDILGSGLDKRTKPYVALWAAIGALGLILLVFANLNFIYGTKANFTPALSRSEAVYVAVGVVSTVGFGPIVPHSQAGRLLLTLEMLSEILLIVGAGGMYMYLVQQRYADRNKMPASSSDSGP